MEPHLSGTVPTTQWEQSISWVAPSVYLADAFVRIARGFLFRTSPREVC
jgi:hypothetical protein